MRRFGFFHKVNGTGGRWFARGLKIWAEIDGEVVTAVPFAGLPRYGALCR